MQRVGHDNRVDLYSKARAAELGKYQNEVKTANTLNWMDTGKPDVARVQSALGRVVNVPGGLY